MTKHINPGTDTTINPVVIDDSYRERKQKPQEKLWCNTCGNKGDRVGTTSWTCKITNPSLMLCCGPDDIILKRVGCASHTHTPAHPPEAQQRNEYKFDSNELLLLAHDEWKRREERKHNHPEQDWVAGFLNGFLTDRKWAREHIDALLQAGDPK